MRTLERIPVLAAWLTLAALPLACDSGGGGGGAAPAAGAVALYGTCNDVGDQVGGAYWNSCEPGCDGTNPDYLFCDDFEDGQWAELDADGYFQGTRLHNGPFESYDENDGWGLTIFVPGQTLFGTGYGSNPNEIFGQAYGRCRNEGVGRSDCAVTSTDNASTTKMMGRHEFPGGACVDEFYLRYYVKPLAGYDHGHEKTWVTIQDAARSGIWTGNFQHRFGNDWIDWQGLSAAEPPFRSQNLISPPRPIVEGEWNFVEIHFKLNTPGVANGVIELWVDACGADGWGCTGSATRVMRYTDVTMRDAGDNGLVCALWFENWSNPASKGEKYYDQVIVSRTGPIGHCTSCVSP